MSRPRDERGSAAIEAAIGLPAFVLFLGLVIFGGRVALAHSAVEAATSDAARAASISRDALTATTAANEAARSGLRNQHIDCRHTTVRVDAGGFHTPIGAAGSVSVTVVCRLDLTDLSAPFPGSRTIRATVSSPIDTWRERGTR